MKYEESHNQLKKKAEKIVNFTPKEISTISSDEIQRLFYDMQVYQIELEMQNDELAISQRELEMSRNRFHVLYHQIPVGIVIVDYQGFMTDSNDYFCQMLNMTPADHIKRHFTSLVLENDKNQWINRFDAFFKSPEKKSMILSLQGNLKSPLSVKLMGRLEDGSDFGHENASIESSKLIITVTDISDVDRANS